MTSAAKLRAENAALRQEVRYLERLLDQVIVDAEALAARVGEVFDVENATRPPSRAEGTTGGNPPARLRLVPSAAPTDR